MTELIRYPDTVEIVSKSKVIMRILGITPPTDDEVLAHKKYEEAKHPSSIMWQLSNTIGANCMRFVLLLGLVVSVAGLLISISGISVYCPADLAMTALFAFGVGLSVAFAVFLIRLSEGKSKGPVRWRISTIHIANLKEMEELPAYVKERIKIVREFVPDATFSIEKLIQGMWVLDPIVRAHFRKEGRRFVIAIYDENDNKIF